MPIKHERERALVLAAVTGVLDACWAAEGDLSDVAWGWTLRRLDELGLAARIWSEAARVGALSRVPSPSRERLERRAQETAASAALFSAAALGAGAVLDAANIAWMPMKGAALALVAPEYGATRPAVDVDLIVAPGDLERARRALGAALPLLGERRDYDGLERDADAAMRDGIQHLYAFEGLGGVPIELHHAFPGLTQGDFTRAVFERAAPAVARGQPVLLPALDDLLGTACVHAHAVHPGDRAMGLRLLADVSELLARGASAGVACDRYDAVGGLAAVSRTLRDLAQAREEARTRAETPTRASLAVDPGVGGRLHRWTGAIWARADRTARVLRTHGIRAIVPPRSFMVGLYGSAAAGPRLPLLHLRRWGAVVLRTIKGR